MIDINLMIMLLAEGILGIIIIVIYEMIIEKRDERIEELEDEYREYDMEILYLKEQIKKHKYMIRRYEEKLGYPGDPYGRSIQDVERELKVKKELLSTYIYINEKGRASEDIVKDSHEDLMKDYYILHPKTPMQLELENIKWRDERSLIIPEGMKTKAEEIYNIKFNKDGVVKSGGITFILDKKI